MKNSQSTIMKFSRIKTVFLCFLLMNTLFLFGQQAEVYPLKQITGKVIDGATGNSLAGVHVQAYNNPMYAAITGDDGTYSIKVPNFVTSLFMQLEDFNQVQCPINNRLKGVDVTLTSNEFAELYNVKTCLLYTSPSPRDGLLSRMPSSA